MAVGLSIGQVSNSAGAIYTVPSGKTTQVKTIIFFNNNSTSENVQVWAVPNSGGSVGTAANSNRILNLTLGSGNTFEFSPAFPISLSAQNDTIQASSTSASQVTYLVLGIATNV